MLQNPFSQLQVFATYVEPDVMLALLSFLQAALQLSCLELAVSGDELGGLLPALAVLALTLWKFTLSLVDVTLHCANILSLRSLVGVKQLGFIRYYIINVLVPSMKPFQIGQLL